MRLIVQKYRCVFDNPIKGEERAGIIIKDGKIQLATDYKPFKRFYIYYGELASSGIPDYSQYDVLICADSNTESTSKVMQDGCRVFQYVYFGSRFEDTQTFIDNTKQTILNLKTSGAANGIFFDECDVTYWKEDYTQDDLNVFSNAMKTLCDFVRSIGMQCVVNGSVGFAKYGDYWLWESFVGTWSSWSAYWQPDGENPPRREAGDGTTDTSLNYYFPIEDLILTGSLSFDANKNIVGSDGTIELIFDTDKLQSQDIKNIYDWVYVEWWGEGMTNSTVHGIAYEGNSLPYNSSTWTQIPDLDSGEAESWDGIGGQSKYIRIVLTITNAPTFKLEKIMIAFQYVYNYYDMSPQANEIPNFNPYEWHWSTAQRDWIWENISSKTQVLTHTYGKKTDLDKQLFCYACALIWGFPIWDYVHPMMQDVYPDDIYKSTYGKLLNRINDNHAIFTGSELSVDLVNHTVNEIISKPSYYYDKAVNMETGEGFTDSDKVYENNTGKDYNVYSYWYGMYGSTFSQGTKVNLKKITRDGTVYIELVSDGVGTWESPIKKSVSGTPLAEMLDIEWDGDSGATLEVKWQRQDGTWTEYVPYPVGDNTVSEYFKQFQVKLTLNGLASTGSGETFVQGTYFTGAYFTWKLPLFGSAIITDLSIKDDNNFLYLKYSTLEPIDFSKNNYTIFLNTRGDTDYTRGYKGDWFESGYGVDIEIDNDSLYVWDDTHTPNTDYQGFQFIKELDSFTSADGKSRTLVIDKKLIKSLVKNIRFFMTSTDSTTWFVSMISGGFHVDDNTGLIEIDTDFQYIQNFFEMFVPHGYYCSDIIQFKTAKVNPKISWTENKPTNTDIKVWGKFCIDDIWGEWVEVYNDEFINGTITKFQYCVGLYTTDGNITPTINNIKIG